MSEKPHKITLKTLFFCFATGSIGWALGALVGYWILGVR